MARGSFVGLRERGLLVVAGPDRASFLQGLVSNDVDKVSDASAIHAALLTAQGATVTRQAERTLAITGATSDAIGELAKANGLTLTELSAHQASLEERYMELTRDSADYHAAASALGPGRR